MKIRKLLPLLLTVTLLGSLFVAVPANAAAEHVIPAGDVAGTFDGVWNGAIDSSATTYVPTASEGVPTGWVLSKRQGSNYNPGTETVTNDVLKANDRTRSGEEGAWAYQLQNTDGKEDVILTLSDEYVNRFKPGNTYKISFWAKGTQGSFPGFKFTLTPFQQFSVGYQAPVNKTTWSYVEDYVTIPQNTTDIILNMDMGKTWVIIDDLSILCMGVAKEAGSNLISADAQWEMEEATVENGKFTVNAGGSAAYMLTLPSAPADVYTFTADVDASALQDGDLRIDLDSYDAESGKIPNTTAKDFFFNRYSDIRYGFAKGASKIKFNIYPADKAKSIKLTLINYSETAAFTMENITVKEANELVSDGAFESLPVVTKYLDSDTPETSSSLPGWYVSNGSIDTTQKAFSVTDAAKDFRLIQPMRVQGGKYYRFSYEIYSENGNTADADWFIDTNTACPVYYENYKYTDDLGTVSVTKNAWVTNSAIIKIPTEFVVTDKKTGATKVELFETEEIVIRFRSVSSGKLFDGKIRNLSLSPIPVFYDANGVEAKALETGATYNVVLDHILPKDTAGTMVLALYNISNAGVPQLVSVNVDDRTADSTYFSLAQSITMPSEEGTYKLCAYTLDSVTGLTPLSHKFTLK